ncbi:hypothetical protein K9M16_02045 [Candidatus Babeliales bacterium]|nr:hypothetical protein [Candidatus Babeliales bacterium]
MKKLIFLFLTCVLSSGILTASETDIAGINIPDENQCVIVYTNNTGQIINTATTYNNGLVIFSPMIMPGQSFGFTSTEISQISLVRVSTDNFQDINNCFDLDINTIRGQVSIISAAGGRISLI